MYRTKQTVDKHVNNILARVKDEKERNSKGYQIAKLYYEVNEYELSKRYLSGFLSINENFAPAHKLLGQILEKLQRTPDAVESYKRSFDLDDRQTDVLLKICELYCQTEIDPERAKYWAEKAEKHFPKNDIVFRLREKIYTESDVKNKNEELENLIASELAKRPDDPVLRAKLLHLYIDMGRVNEAYEHATEAEKRGVYPNSLDWYQALADVFQVYQEGGGNGHQNFLENLLSVQCSLVRLHMENGKVADCAEALYRFDQTLKTASKQEAADERLATFLSEMQAQLYYQAATLLLKRAQQDHLNWPDAYAMAGACYMMSYATPPFSMQLPWVVGAQGDDKRVLNMLRSLACVRASISGHMLQNLNDWDSHRWRQKVKENYLTHLGFNKIFDALFTLRQMKESKDSSYMLNNDEVTVCDTKHPTDSELREFDAESHMYMGDCLHKLVWLALQRYSVKDVTQPMYGFHVFDDLQYTTGNLETAAPETLSQLDTEAFLYAVVRCSAVRLEERSRVGASPRGQSYLPPVLMETLVSKEQAEWWTAAYTLYKNQAKEQLAKLRLKLQRGLETIRLVGNHGIKPTLLVHLAKTFEERMAAVKAKGQGPLDFASDAADLELRAAHYWKEAVKLLERTKQNQGMPSPKVVLFQLDRWTMEEVAMDTAIEEGKFFLACEAMNAGNYEEAITAFEKLKSSEASYNMAQIYSELAEDDLVRASEGDELREEDKEHYRALLIRARDKLYVTLDRIRGNKHHKLTPQLAPEIDEIESKLNALAAGNSPSSAEGSFIASPRISPYKPKGLTAVTHSTPARPLHFSLAETPGHPSPHLQPSPERLDAQIRSMAYSQDMLMKHLLDRNEELRAQNASLVEEMKENKEMLAALKEKVESLEAAQRTASPARPSVASSAPTSAASTPKHGPLPPRPPPPEMTAHMYPAVPGHPPHAYYPYPPPPTEYDYGAYYPQHMYPHLPYGYGSPAPIHHPAASMYKPPAGPVPAQPQPQPQPQAQPRVGMVATASSQDDDDDTDYYTYDDNEFDDTKGDACQAGRGLAGERPLVQDWPFGTAVAMEGKSTVTYSPSQPALHQAGIFNQMPAPTPQSLMFPAAAPPMPGPGFFSSPDRAASGFNPQYPVSGAPLNLHGSPLTSLQAPKPGFFSTTTSVANTSTVPSSTQFGTTQNALAGTTLYKAAEPTVVVSASMHSILPAVSSQVVPTSPVSPGSKPATSFPITFSSLPTPGGIMAPRVPITAEDQPEDDEDEDGLEDSYQGPDFEPVIPLPDEVEVKTGEEGEKIFFSAYGKLYRFVDKQWKERGRGEIKILFNEASAVARIVMRREQVLKVCANHLIKPDMTLEFKDKKDTRILTWKALDFAEEEPVLEQFCIRFKEEVGVQFKENFEEVQKMVGKPTKPRTPKTEKKQEDLFAKFKPAAGSWSCKECYVNNAAGQTKCVACGNWKPGAKQESAPQITTGAAGGFTFGTPAASSQVDTSASKPITAVSGFGDKFKPKAGSWTCDTCCVNNEAAVTACVACSTQKPGTVADKKTDSLASTGSCAGFTFGRPAAAASATTKPSTGFSIAPASSSGFPIAPASTTIGSGTSSGFSIAPATAASTPSTGFKFGASTVASAAPASTTASTGLMLGSVTAASTWPSTTTATTGFKFGPTPAAPTTATTATTGFTFGTATVASSATTTTTTTTASTGFRFGSPAVATTATTTAATQPGFTTPSSSMGPKPTPSAGFTFDTPSSSAAAGPSATSTAFGGASPGTPATTAPVISPPKFSFTSKPVFGNPASTASSGFTFGTPTTAATTTTTTAAKPATTNVFGGFTFTTKPVVTDKKEPERDQAKPVSPLKDEKKADSAKSNPFAGFSFTTPSKDTPDGAASSKDATKPVSGTPTSKPAAASPSVFGSVKPADKASPSMFGSNLGNQTFASLVQGTSGKDAISKAKDSKPFSNAGAPVFEAPRIPCSAPADDDEDKVEEFEPEVDFAPVVPLPELVEVKTGEEDENCLFSERAKLFRYDAETSQWKERGVGQMKILSHKETGRPRILMRRQQVLKLCANHSITADMKLNPLETSDRAWCWLAQDYADDEMKNENLAVRFKTVEQAESFQEVFVGCQEKVRTSDASTDASKPAEDTAQSPATTESKEGKATVGWGDQFKPKPGAWECPGCYVSNTAAMTKCLACQTANPAAAVEANKPAPSTAAAPKSSWGDLFKPKPGEWECPGCYVKNQADVVKCPACNNLKPGATAADVPASGAAASSGFSSFSFGSSGSSTGAAGGFVFGRSTTDSSPAPSTGFTFGKPATSTSTESSGAAASGFTFNKPVTFGSSTPTSGADKPSTAFTFGTGTSSSGFTFTPSTPKTGTSPGTVRSPQTPTSPDGSDLYQNNEGDDDHIYFEPLVSLPKVVVKTGEENEEVLYSHRAKLYRFSNGEWKERGLGDVKLLQDKDTKKVRLLMRREQILKICLNHIVTPDLELKPMPNADGKAWTWHAEDFSEDEPAHEKFALRFRNSEIANAFKEAFEDGQDRNVKSGSPVKADKKKVDVKKEDKKDESRKSLDAFSFKSPSSQTNTPTVFGSPGAVGATSTFGTARGFTFGQAVPPTQASADSSQDAPASPCTRGRTILASLLEQTAKQDAEEDEVVIIGEDLPTPGRVHHAKDYQLPAHFYNYEKADPCPGCIGCDDEEHDHDVLLVDEVLPSPEKIAMAEKYMLPRHFYNYEFAPPCPGCIGCEPEDLKDKQKTSKAPAGERPIKPTVTPICGGDKGNPYYAKELDQAARAERPIKPTVTPICGGDDGNPYYAEELDQAASGEGLIEPTVMTICGGDDGNPYYAAELDQGVSECVEDAISATVTNICGDRGNPYYAAELDKDVSECVEDTVSATVTNVCGDRGNPYYAAELDKGVVESTEGPISATVTNVCGDRGNPYYAAQLDKGVVESPISATVTNVSGDRGNPHYAAELDKGVVEIPVSATVSNVCGDRGNPHYAAELDKGVESPISATVSNVSGVCGNPHYAAELDKGVVESPISAMVSNVCGDRGNPHYAAELHKGAVESPISATVSNVSGDRGNPHYAAELEKGVVESPISATVSNVSGDRGNPHYAAELDKGVVESPISTVVSNVCGDRGNPHYAAELEKGVVESPISATFSNVSGDRGNPHYAAELDKEAAKPSSTKSSTTVSEADSTTTTTSPGKVFGSGIDFSFATVASASKGFAFGNKDGNKPFNWQGAGSSVFRRSPSKSGDHDDENSVEPSPDVHFEPLVSLPEVEVKTGEEEEEVLYCQRSKLFRFDGSQWKERGLGEMKLLQHPDTRHIRLLMRREQVLKTACNHRLTLDMELKPMTTSETSMCWHALDFAEGEPQHEQFALKFKNKDLALAFKEKVEECQEMIRNQPPDSGGAGDAASVDVSAADTSAADTSAADSSVADSSACDTSAADTSAADTSAADTTVDDSHHYEDEEEYEDDDLQPLFQKRATMFYAQESAWKTIGMGELLVTYDDDLNAYRISMNSDEGYAFCNHLICQEYRIQSNEKKRFCEWTAKDFATNEPMRRTFRVCFSSSSAVSEFRKVFHEGINMAHDSEIWEVPDNAGEMEVPIKAGIAKDNMK